MRIAPATLLAVVASAACTTTPPAPVALSADVAPTGRASAYEHALVLHEQRADFGGTFAGSFATPAGTVALAARATSGTYTSRPLDVAPFQELLPSWNVAVPAGAGFCVELRVGRRSDGLWSPWLYAGDWGEPVPGVARVERFDGGRVEVDWFRSDETFDRVQYRVRARRAPDGEGPELVRFALCLSRRGQDEPPSRAGAIDPDPRAWQRRLPVPFRSQRAEGPALASRICSPTSVAMVLAYRGVERPTAEVAALLYDAQHDIYGNWPRAVQGAFTYGVPGYVARFDDWADVRGHVAAGQPLVCSIAAKDGELRGAPYGATSGHLLVLVGFDERGDVLVNDPAAVAPEQGRATYRRDDFERVWMARGGTAYVLLPRS